MRKFFESSALSLWGGGDLFCFTQALEERCPLITPYTLHQFVIAVFILSLLALVTSKLLCWFTPVYIFVTALLPLTVHIPSTFADIQQ